MFFFLSKTLDELVTPLFWALVLTAVALVAVWRRAARAASGAAAAAIAVLYFFSVEPVSNALLHGLEASARPAPREAHGPPYDAVIVLGGLVNQYPETPDYTDAIDRLLAGFEELRTGRARHALLCGGRTAPDQPSPESVILEKQLEQWGIAADRITVDDRSRNTHQNAVEAARIVRQKGWTRLLLVTSAFHMQRAAGCFRREGLKFDTLAVDYRTYGSGHHPVSWLPRVEALSESTMAIREYVGRLVYVACGYAVE